MKKHATPIFDKRARQYGSGDRTSAQFTKNGNAQKQKASNWKERRKKTFTPKIINASIQMADNLSLILCYQKNLTFFKFCKIFIDSFQISTYDFDNV